MYHRTKCRVVSYTGRYSHLIGYDTNTIKFGKIPIVTAYLKIMAHNGIPEILKIHETHFNEISPIEYQIMEHGMIIDSVANLHKTGCRAFGTQGFQLNILVYVPLLDRGGLMGCEVLPFVEGDDEMYDIFEITHSDKWIPARFKEKKATVPKDLEEFPEFDATL